MGENVNGYTYYVDFERNIKHGEIKEVIWKNGKINNLTNKKSIQK